MTNRHYQNYLKEVNEAKKRKKKSEAAKYKELFMAQLKFAGLKDHFIPNENHPQELKFHPDRLWRFDFSCQKEKIAVEIQGGAWGNPVKCHRCNQVVMRRLKDGRMFMIREGGRHQSASRLEGEYEKLNEAQRLGWRVFFLSPQMVRDQSGINLIKSLFPTLE